MRVLVVRHRWKHSPAVLLPVLLSALFLAACSSGAADGPPLASEAAADATTDPTPPPSTPDTEPTPPDEAAVNELWQQTLAIFEIPDENNRAAAAAQLDGQVPTEDILQNATRALISSEPIELTSNAVFTPTTNGELKITDCADSVGISTLGQHTAGFTGTAATDPNGTVILTEFATFRSCIQKDIAEAVISQYELLLQSTKELWKDPRIDHPAIGPYQTDASAQRSRDYFAELEENGWLGDTFLQLDSVEEHLEIIFYEPGEIRIRNCEHGDETYGLFDGNGQRIDELGPPWQAQLIVRMINTDDEWLFDGLINRTNGACDTGTSINGLRPL